MSWFGHVSRHDTLENTILQGRVEGTGKEVALINGIGFPFSMSYCYCYCYCYCYFYMVESFHPIQELR